MGKSSVAGRCLLCGASGGPIVMEENGYVGRNCTCGIVYIDPPPETGLVSPTDDLHPESYYAVSARPCLAWARRFCPAGRFLHVGCGNGALVARALAAGYEVWAIEPNVACADEVAARHGIPVERALVEDSQLPHGAFDVVFHVDLLSHFPDPERALRVMGDLATGRGFVCFQVSLSGGLPAAWYPWLGRPGFPAHRWFYSEPALTELLRRAGLEVVELKRLAAAPSTILSSLLRRILPRAAARAPRAKGGASRGSPARPAYERLHGFLRYNVGAALSLPGPATAFVAARPVRSGRRSGAPG